MVDRGRFALVQLIDCLKDGIQVLPLVELLDDLVLHPFFVLVHVHPGHTYVVVEVLVCLLGLVAWVGALQSD